MLHFNVRIRNRTHFHHENCQHFFTVLGKEIQLHRDELKVNFQTIDKFKWNVVNFSEKASWQVRLPMSTWTPEKSIEQEKQIHVIFALLWKPRKWQPGTAPLFWSVSDRQSNLASCLTFQSFERLISRMNNSIIMQPLCYIFCRRLHRKHSNVEAIWKI